MSSGYTVAMRRPATLILVLACASLCAAQVIDYKQPVDWNLPSGAKCLQQNQLGLDFRLSSRLNPFYLRGDFDGDGKPDYAVLVENTKSKAVVMAICLSTARKPVLIGGGNGPVNVGPSLDWMDAWEVYDKGPVQPGADEDAPPKLRGDAILMRKTESASGLLYWDGHKFLWYQQGD